MIKCIKVVLAAIVVGVLLGIIHADEAKEASELQRICQKLDFDVPMEYRYPYGLSKKYKKILSRAKEAEPTAKAVNNLRDLIRQWTNQLENHLHFKRPALGSNLFGFGSTYPEYREEQERKQLSAMSYLYYEIAKKYLESKQLIAAAATMMHLKSLRHNVVGIDMRLVLELNDRIKVAMREACEASNIDILLGCSGCNDGVVLGALEWRLVYDTFKPSFNRASPTDNQNNILRDMIKLAYGTKMTEFRARHSQVEQQALNKLTDTNDNNRGSISSDATSEIDPIEESRIYYEVNRRSGINEESHDNARRESHDSIR